MGSIGLDLGNTVADRPAPPQTTRLVRTALHSASERMSCLRSTASCRRCPSLCPWQCRVRARARARARAHARARARARACARACARARAHVHCLVHPSVRAPVRAPLSIHVARCVAQCVISCPDDAARHGSEALAARARNGCPRFSRSPRAPFGAGDDDDDAACPEYRYGHRRNCHPRPRYKICHRRRHEDCAGC
eukprot:5427731-Pleurochrysis_carterae.AAC.4